MCLGLGWGIFRGDARRLVGNQEFWVSLLVLWIK